MTTETQAESMNEDVLRAELLGDSPIADPSVEEQREILQEIFKQFSNSYFAARRKFVVAHESGLTHLEGTFFEDAIKFREAVLKTKAMLDALPAKGEDEHSG